METFIAYYRSPLGVMRLAAKGDRLTEALFTHEKTIPAEKRKPAREIHPVLREWMKALDAYFNGSLKNFSLETGQEGSAFQLRVWNELLRIPYGETISYLELARRIGDEKTVRAVGAANGSNPVCIVIPCHRVIGSNGKLIGYGGGLWRKQWLLEHELQFSTTKAGLLF